MPYDLYWQGDAWAVVQFRDAYNYEKQRKSEEMWLQGLYVFNAVSVALSNALAKKGSKPKSYIEEPLRVTPLTEEEKAEKAQKEREKVVNYFNRLAASWEGKERPVR